MENLSLSPVIYYFADYMGGKRGDGSFSLKFFLLYLALKTREGHLRIFMDPADESFSEKIQQEFNYWLEDHSKDVRIRFHEQIKEMVHALPVMLSTNPDIFGKDEEEKPVIMSGPYFYLHKYYHYEKRILRSLGNFLSSRQDFFSKSVQEQAMEMALKHEEHSTSFSLNEEQKKALKTVLEKKFSIVTGGPGTGKTFLVINFLRALLYAHLMEEKIGTRPYVILLAAPTGRAADTLMEKIRASAAFQGRNALQKKIDAALPEKAFTLHRLLQEGLSSINESHPKKLIADAVVVDEASMIDAGQMALLMESIPENGKLILMGDKNQLPSVESGTILADMLPRHRDISPHALTGHITELSEMKRCAKEISDLAQAVNRGDADAAFSLMQQEEMGNPLSSAPVLFFDTDKTAPSDQMLTRLIRVPYPESDKKESFQFKRMDFEQEEGREKIRRIFSIYQNFKILCAIKNGPWGTVFINQKCMQSYADADRIYPGQPVLIVKNDYKNSLYNGDWGMVLDVDGDGLRVVFQDGMIFRKIPPSRLQDYETAYAMTIHKSQGSEADHILLVFPDRPSPVLTREILYTGITRAKKRLWIVGKKSLLMNTIRTPIERNSGIREYLGRPLSYMNHARSK
ncbi:MAG: exodeoxyribonuclease V subunit alpha [Candidatus Aureabacteria bacterium]|nr:exodeoxyribonuclease V subunit alpha [Candidatus Auribacterota bacterium]